MDSSSSSSTAAAADSTVTHESYADWPPSFSVLVTKEWVVKSMSSCSSSKLIMPQEAAAAHGEEEAAAAADYIKAAHSCCNGNSSSYSSDSQFLKLPLTGLDVCRARIGVMQKVLLFDHLPAALVVQEKDADPAPRNDHDAKEEETAGFSSSSFKGLAARAVSVRLRESLAKALDACRPLAGRLVQEGDGTLVIECNDKGVPFIEAYSPIALEELRDDRLLHTYENFAPLERSEIPDIGSFLDDCPLLAVKLTMFKNGGHVVGITINHAVCDGPSFSQFVSLWAEVCRGEEITNPFDFSSRANILNSKPHPDDMMIITSSSSSLEIPSPASREYHDVNVLLLQQQQDHELHELPQPWSRHDVLPNTILIAHKPRLKPNVSNILYLTVEVDLVKKLKSQLAEKQQLLAAPGAGAAAAAAALGLGFSSYVSISALIWRASVRARGIPETEETRFVAGIDCRKRCENIPATYFGNAIVDAVAATAVAEILREDSGLLHAATAIRDSLQLATSAAYIQSMCNVMEQYRRLGAFGIAGGYRREMDVKVAGIIHPAQTPCDFGWGPPCWMKYDRFRVANNVIYWLPKPGGADPFSFYFKSAPHVTAAMLQDPELMTFAKLVYVT